MSWQDRASRLQAIRAVLGERRVSSQEELLRLLAERGYTITQATLSRDLRTLAAGKVPDGRGGYRYALRGQGERTAQTEDRRVILQGFLWMAFSGANGVIRTLPGFANSIASGLDGFAIPEILGTIAGDDTILVVPRDGTTRAGLIQALVERIPELREKLA